MEEINIPEIEVGDRVKVTQVDNSEPIIGIVGQKFERHDSGWDGEYIKVYDPVTNEIRCTTLIDKFVILL